MRKRIIIDIRCDNQEWIDQFEAGEEQIISMFNNMCRDIEGVTIDIEIENSKE